jgi:hypothetical protein
MLSKKMIPIAALLLLALSAALVAGAGKIAQQQVPPAVVVPAPPQAGDKGEPAVPNSSALPSASGTVSFSEDFSANKLDAWRNLPEATGTWKAKDGRLQSVGNVDGNLTSDDIALVTNFSDFSDGTFEAMVYPTNGEAAGVLFRGSDAGYYRLNLYVNVQNNSPKARLQKVGAGGAGAQEIAVNKTWAGLALSQWHRIEVRTAGNHIVALVDGTQLFDVTDAGPTSGWVGVWTVATVGVQFDNIRVQRGAAGR